MRWRINEYNESILNFELYILNFMTSSVLHIPPISQAVLRWPGSKWRLAPKLVQLMPEHLVYVEVCGGSGAVMLHKEPLPGEVYNDVDGDVVLFWEVVRDPVERELLAEAVFCTPYAREGFEEASGDAYLPGTTANDRVERVRRFLVRCWMRNYTKTHARRNGFDCRINKSDGYNRTRSWMKLPGLIQAVGERFRGVIIEQKPAVELMPQYDREGVLFFVDPPYLDTRKRYASDFRYADFFALARVMLEAKGMVMLAGYPSVMHRELFEAEGWERVDFTSRTENAAARKECVWMNPALVKSRKDERHNLFGVKL